MFNDYQTRAASTFKNAQPITDEQKIHALDWSLGLGGETGEVLDIIKHSIFHGEELDRMELAKELGDVLWYVNAICTTMNMSLADIAALNLAKLEHRYKAGYSASASLNRHGKEALFKDTPIYKVLEAKLNKTGHAPVNVIFVGPDGAGKTTMIQRLAERLDMPVVKCDYRTEDKVAKAKELLTEQIDVLYDRFYYPDDVIYSQLKNNVAPDYTEVISMLKRHNAILIYVYAPMSILKERSAAWADDYVSVSELSSIICNYENLLPKIEEMGIPVLSICNIHKLDSAEYEEQLVQIEDFIIHHSHQWG